MAEALGGGLGIGGALKGAGGFLGDIFGKSNQQDTSSTTTSGTQFRPEDLAALEAQKQAVQQQAGDFNRLLQGFQQQAAGSAAKLSDIQAPQFSTELDALSQNILSQGQQGLLGQAAAQRANIARQFAGQQGVSQALQAKAGINAALAANPLLAGVQQAQAGRELGQQQLLLAGQQAANQAKLAQQQAGAAARGEAAGFGGTGVQSGQQLLGLLSQLAGQLGQQQTVSQKTTKGRSGGLFG